MVKKNVIKLTESIWDYTPSDTSSHTSFINFGSYLIMVDTGMNSDNTKKLREFAEETTGLKFKYVLITHHHGDHTFGTKHFKDCNIISTESTKQILETKVKGDYKDKGIILPNVTFTGEYEIREDDKIIKFIETNGHTEGSAFVYLPEEEVILTGDLLFANMFPFAGDPTVNPFKWIKALQKMIELKPKIVIPGHGDISSISELKEQKTQLAKLVDIIEVAIYQGMSLERIKKNTIFKEENFPTDSRWFKMTLERFYDEVKKKLGR